MTLTRRVARPPGGRLSFALAIFLGAFLLFQVQPLMGKFILPWFGGSPGVWTACLLFFQVVLLAGYAYAHLISRFLAPRVQAVLHGVLLLAALTFLPITPAAHWKPTPDADPTGSILLLLLVCLGLPYFVLSSTGPLLQAWVNRLNPGRAPYRLYALSNLASLLALISYPLAFEPTLTRQAQADFWAVGLICFVLLCGRCAGLLWRANPTSISLERPEQRNVAPSLIGGEGHSERIPEPECPPAPGNRPLWFALSACGSVLLLGTTNKLCQDVAVIPFLWVLPLCLYLLSFVLCFDNPAWYLRKVFSLSLIPMLSVLCFVMLLGTNTPLYIQIAVYCGTLFLGCVVCHGEIYRLRPSPRWLTSFYLFLATGGAAGGLFVAVVAPLVFNSYAEFNAGLCLLAALVLFIHAREKTVWRIRRRPWRVWPLAFSGLVVLGLVWGLLIISVELDKVSMTRNFYGVVRVEELHRKNEFKDAYQLSHGNTVHGLQFVHLPGALIPTLYYSDESGVGLAFRCLSRQPNRRIGLVGLGAGTLSAYGRAGDLFRYYEINPEIQRLAETRFTYLKHSPSRVEVVRGDARLSLENEPPQQFDLLVLDAFSSDAIPVHLLTREAFALYLRHLNPDGVIAVHLSNRYLHLWPVVQGIANNFHLERVHLSWKAPSSHWWLGDSSWALLSYNSEFLKCNPILKAANPSSTNAVKALLWTDDFTSLFPIVGGLRAGRDGQ